DEHHQGRAQPGERQEMVRLGADRGGAGARGPGAGLPGALEQERGGAARGPGPGADPADRLRLRQVRQLGRAHAPAQEVARGGILAAALTCRPAAPSVGGRPSGRPDAAVASRITHAHGIEGPCGRSPEELPPAADCTILVYFMAAAVPLVRAAAAAFINLAS